MTAIKYVYNANLAKGTGLINETLTLTEFYKEGDSKESFLNRCISHNILNKSTEHRTKDIINLVFYQRYWNVDYQVVKNLKDLREYGLSLEGLKSLFYVYTARANQVLFDFVLELGESNQNQKINNETSKSFLLRAISSLKAPAWSDSIIKRVSSYLISCLKDFDLIDREGTLKMNHPNQMVVNYLLHELHFMGLSDGAIVQNKVWKLFGLSENDIITEIEKISFKGTFIFQHSGEILRIGWKYHNMDEFIENEYR
ncbi:DUF1819 family protein [Kaistella flava (ex Peng et al. 2021)]|uniref:DUF1819 family protein n=1 Tax=Kaistella flava (ex Peng et al. 2021) TaxID=2038776 RepID=A0A7M2Y6B5_9FLAO|nr:BrxA family protein [Kaistella flava (ex Peng et al. 2021)]QOW09787.1 DUF1819 family protein [Kaistella flava (ex Peng et al. 2021)]